MILSPPDSPMTPLQILRQVFGHADFRNQQSDIIERTLKKKDSLVIMPTGGGKSLCYQIPALVQDGIALIISPLIALMADQVTALQSNQIEAAYVNSSQTLEERKQVLKKIEQGQLKLLYVSPEKALSRGFIDYFQRQNISLIAIDEAHCVSIWGHDFRPDYAQLKSLVKHFPEVPVIALTATADQATQVDICNQLGLRDPEKFVSSFERENIQLSVFPGQNRRQQILHFLEAHPGQPGIIYCLSRRNTEELAMKLRRQGWDAAHYHAEISTLEKRRLHEAFQKDEIQIICATIAFGMGIDKSNIRWIIHYNLPKNIESYYQEIGRAGRDGAAAEAVLFYSHRDVDIFRHFINENKASPSFKSMQHAKLDRMWDFTQAAHCRTNVILNYFGEYRSEGCGHCDNCLHPPTTVDGTDYAKMAINLIGETKVPLSIQFLIDALRGSERKAMYHHQLTALENYGRGKSIPRLDWQHMITQFIHQGILEIDYTQNSKLKLTSLSPQVSEGNLKVSLTKSDRSSTRYTQPAGGKKVRYRKAYLQELMRLRKQIARRENLPPYLIFSDQVIENIFNSQPIATDDLDQLIGLSEFKRNKYGAAIIATIQQFVTQQTILKTAKGKSMLDTLQRYRDGWTPKEIAEEQHKQITTIYSHLVQLYERGENIELMRYISTSEIDDVKAAWEACNFSEKISEISEALPGTVDLSKIKMAIAILRKRQQVHRADAKVVNLSISGSNA